MRHQPDYSHALWLAQMLRPDQLHLTLKAAVPILQQYDFDAFAFQGMSGALLATPFALAMDKTIIMVRKPDDKSHTQRKVEGDCGARRYVILDDLIASGSTICRIITGIRDWAPKAECIGIMEVVTLAPDIARGNLENIDCRGFTRTPGKITLLKPEFDPALPEHLHAAQDLREAQQQSEEIRCNLMGPVVSLLEPQQLQNIVQKFVQPDDRIKIPF